MKKAGDRCLFGGQSTPYQDYGGIAIFLLGPQVLSSPPPSGGGTSASEFEKIPDLRVRVFSPRRETILRSGQHA